MVIKGDIMSQSDKRKKSTIRMRDIPVSAYKKYFYRLLFIIAIIELLIMFFLHYIQLDTGLLEPIIDTTLLTVISFPFIIKFVINPFSKDVNKDISKELSDKIDEVTKQDKIIISQSRQAAMGEMMSMIAHQWRQPLSAISAISSTLSLDVMMDHYKKDFFTNRLNSIAELTQHLSSTIDDFRNFYKPNKIKTNVKLEEILLKTLNIIKPSLLNDNIEIIQEYNSKEEIEIYDNEMIQVMLNLFKNAQDNFKEKQTKNPYIKIITENRTISVCDNGGGIPEDIIEKIFDPYFSTKNEKNGTGLGLYMSKTIIEEHHNGKLTVQNIDDTQGASTGVCFIIELE
jgi:signal transduction histidine kinase